MSDLRRSAGLHPHRSRVWAPRLLQWWRRYQPRRTRRRRRRPMLQPRCRPRPRPCPLPWPPPFFEYSKVRSSTSNATGCALELASGAASAVSRAVPTPTTLPRRMAKKERRFMPASGRGSMVLLFGPASCRDAGPAFFVCDRFSGENTPLRATSISFGELRAARFADHNPRRPWGPGLTKESRSFGGGSRRFGRFSPRRDNAATAQQEPAAARAEVCDRGLRDAPRDQITAVEPLLRHALGFAEQVNRPILVRVAKARLEQALGEVEHDRAGAHRLELGRIELDAFANDALHEHGAGPNLLGGEHKAGVGGELGPQPRVRQLDPVTVDLRKGDLACCALLQRLDTHSRLRRRRPRDHGLCREVEGNSQDVGVFDVEQALVIELVGLPPPFLGMSLPIWSQSRRYIGMSPAGRLSATGTRGSLTIPHSMASH